MAEEKKKMPAGEGLPEMPEEIKLAPVKKPINWWRIFFILLGAGIFTRFYLVETLPDAVDPAGKVFQLSWEGKLAIGLFLMAGIWWVFEVMRIGATSIAIGVVQTLFWIRPAKQALGDFLDPAVWFIFGSVVIGMAFSAVGLTKRMAYKKLDIVGERTSMIYLGAFIVTAAMTHLMAHTGVAAAIFPLLLAINSLYNPTDQPTRFGKGLFIGMAWVAGAGSIVTYLGAARGVAASGMFLEFTGYNVGFFELSYYMFPVGWIMVFLLYLVIMVIFRPERPRIEGLREKAQDLSRELGPMTTKEYFVICTVALIVVLFMLNSFLPKMGYQPFSRAGIVLIATLAFFPDQNAHHRGLGGYPLEYHSPVRRRHVHRLLPLADRRGAVAGRPLADHVPTSALAGICAGHFLFCADDDQLHHECGRHCHFPAGIAGNCQVLRGGSACDSVCLAGGGRDALQPAGRGVAERHRL